MILNGINSLNYHLSPWSRYLHFPFLLYRTPNVVFLQIIQSLLSVKSLLSFLCIMSLKKQGYDTWLLKISTFPIVLHLVPTFSPTCFYIIIIKNSIHNSFIQYNILFDNLKVFEFFFYFKRYFEKKVIIFKVLWRNVKKMWTTRKYLILLNEFSFMN